jgi:GntR family transcriptional repressor for pyruvate dehydrogenase complex
MNQNDLINHFKRIEFPDSADLVIQQIRDLIHDGRLKSGSRLPSEKKLEERTGVPRSQIGRALRRLETFGILQTVPQSGTYVNDIGVTALEGLLSNLIKVEEKDLKDMADTRLKLEEFAVTLLIERATDQEIDELAAVQSSMVEKISKDTADFDDDMVFHIKLAEYSKNTTLKAVLSLLTVEFIQTIKKKHELFRKDRLRNRLREAAEEHREVIAAIKRRNPDEAVEALRKHYQKAAAFNLK